MEISILHLKIMGVKREMLRVQNMAGDAVEIPYHPEDTIYDVRKAARSTLFADQQNTADYFWKCTLFYEKDRVYRVIPDDAAIQHQTIYAAITSYRIIWSHGWDNKWDEEIQFGDEAFDDLVHNIHWHLSHIICVDSHGELIPHNVYPWVQQEWESGRLLDSHQWTPWDRFTGLLYSDPFHVYHRFFIVGRDYYQLALDCADSDDTRFQLVLRKFGTIHDDLFIYESSSHCPIPEDDRIPETYWKYSIVE